MKQETMTPNPKHLEILGEVTGLEIGALKYLSFLDTTIAAMQILQNRIDELEKENERLKESNSEMLKVLIARVEKNDDDENNLTTQE